MLQRISPTLLLCLLAALAGWALPAAAVPAHYVVLSAGDGLSPRATFYRQVELDATFESLDNSQLLSQAAETDSRQHLAAQARLSDGHGKVAFQTVVRIPRWRRSETLLPENDPRTKARGTRMEPYIEPLAETSVVLRLPVIEGASVLELDYGPVELRTSARLDLDDLARQFSGSAQSVEPLVAGATFEAVPGFQAGASGNRVDILLVAEGYRATDLAAFRNHTNTFTTGFMNALPFSAYRSHFNFWRLHVPSVDAGADRPTCSDPDDEGLDDNMFFNTAFDASYCASNIWRLLTVNNSKVFAAASEHPNWDQIITIVQSEHRGGSGGSIAVTSLDDNNTVTADLISVMLHEFAHSFGDLADEYDDPYPGFPVCSDTNSSTSDNCERNVTNVSHRSGIKWKHWLAAATPVPTTAPLADPLDAGLWEGARYLDQDMYRQCFDGIMRNTARPFCRVDREAMLISMYKGGWGIPSLGVSTIEPGSRLPAAASITLNPGEPVTLSARTFAPPAGPNMTVEWYINALRVRSSSVTPGATSSFTFSEFEPGTTWTVRMKAIDNSTLIHSSVRPQLAREQLWTIVIRGSGCPTCLAEQ